MANLPPSTYNGTALSFGGNGSRITVRLDNGRTVSGIARNQINAGRVSVVVDGRGGVSVFNPARQGVIRQTTGRFFHSQPLTVVQDATYGAAIIWLRDFFFPQIEGSNTRYTERWLFWIAGDRVTPYLFDDLTVTYSLPFTTAAAGGDRRVTYAILEGNRISFNAGLAANFARAGDPDDFQIVGANTYTLQAGRDTVSKSAALPIPYGNWVNYLIDPNAPGTDACLDFAANSAVSKIGSEWFLASITIPTTGSPQNATATLTPIRSPNTSPNTFCPLPVPPKYGTVRVFPVNVGAITAAYTPTGTTSTTINYLATAARLRSTP